MPLPSLFEGIYDPLQMYQLATLCRLNYNPTDARWRNIANGFRTHLQRIVLSEDGSGGFPRTDVLMLSDRNVIVIGGTANNVRDWANNLLNLEMIPLRDNRAIAVGSQFWTKMQLLEDALTLNKVDLKKPTVVTGHSLGGAIATCLAFNWQGTDRGPLSVVTFGSPRVGTQRFYQSIPLRNLCRCVYNADFVTQIPQNGINITRPGSGMVVFVHPYTHGGTLIWLNPIQGSVIRVGASPMDGLQMFVNVRGQTDWVPTWGTPNETSVLTQINDHYIFNYVKSWRGNVEGAPRFVLEGFDQCNSGINDTTGELWPTGDFLKTGAEDLRAPLPEDPIEELPYPAPVPTFDPAAPVVMPPRAPTATEIQRRVIRHRQGL